MYVFHVMLVGGLLAATLVFSDEHGDDKLSLLVRDARSAIDNLHEKRDFHAVKTVQRHINQLEKFGPRRRIAGNDPAQDLPDYRERVAVITTELKIEALPVLDALRDKTYDLSQPPESFMASWFIPTNLPPDIIEKHQRELEENRHRHEKLVREKTLHDLCETYKGNVSGWLYWTWKKSSKSCHASNEVERMTAFIDTKISDIEMKRQIFEPMEKERRKHRIAGEKWEEKLITLETRVTQLVHNASVEKKYPALQTAHRHMKVIASDWNWKPGWQMYVKANPDRLFRMCLLLAETAHSLRDYGYDINTPHPPIKVSPPSGPRRFAGMNPDDIDDPADRET